MKHSSWREWKLQREGREGGDGRMEIQVGGRVKMGGWRYRWEGGWRWEDGGTGGREGEDGRMEVQVGGWVEMGGWRYRWEGGWRWEDGGTGGRVGSACGDGEGEGRGGWVEMREDGKGSVEMAR